MCAETAKTRAYRTPASSDAMRRALSDTPRASSGELDVRTLSGWQKKEPVHKRGPRDMSAYCREAPGGSRLPGVGYVWVAGYWRWNGHRHLWVDGHWMRERRGWHWVPAHWVEAGPRWRFVAGHWER